MQYGGGLSDRIKARGVKDLISFSLLNLQGMDSVQIQESLAPQSRYGARASFLWTGSY